MILEFQPVKGSGTTYCRDRLIQRRQKQTNYNGDFNTYMEDQMNRRDQLAVMLLHPDDEDEISSSEDDSDFY